MPPSANPLFQIVRGSSPGSKKGDPGQSLCADLGAPGWVPRTARPTFAPILGWRPGMLRPRQEKRVIENDHVFPQPFLLASHHTKRPVRLTSGQLFSKAESEISVAVWRRIIPLGQHGQECSCGTRASLNGCEVSTKAAKYFSLACWGWGEALTRTRFEGKKSKRSKGRAQRILRLG